MQQATINEQISGLCYTSDYITQNEHDTLLASIDAAPWMTDLQRRVQHYGYRYDYRKRAVAITSYIGVLPDWAWRLARRLCNDGFMPEPADQVIVNEYQPGQGISPHIDCQPCFGDVVASISLGSPCVMNFSRGADSMPVLLESCSLVAFQSEARYRWKHGIAARKTDTYQGITFERERRVSITFRSVVFSG